MKKILTFLLAALLVLSLAACGGAAGASQSASAESPAESGSASASEEVAPFTPVVAGKLTIGTSADFAPYEFHIVDENGQDKIVGFDVALAQAIADKMGLELSIQDMNFDNIITELSMGNIDLGIAGFSPDPERLEVVDFSEIYYFGGQSFMVRKADLEKYKSFADFDGLQVGAQSGSIQAELLAKNTPNATPVLLQAVPNIIMELQNSKIEGAFMETAIADNYIKSYPDLAIAWEVPYDQKGSAVAVKKGSADLLNQVNAVIAEVLANGKMEEYIVEANKISAQAVA